MKIIKVSVCIPVYNVEAYIEKCARSLFEQTLDDLEYVFVDDCSTDRSREILASVLDEYPKRRQQTKIIHHAKNLGVSVSRMEAIRNTIGAYVIHCDADDWIEPTMYERLYSAAVATGSDMVYCSYFRNSENSEFAFPDRQYDDPKDMIKAFCSSKSHCSLWNKLYKSEIARSSDLDLPSDCNMSEDMRLNVQMLLKCRKIFFVDSFFYHWRCNPRSLTGLFRNSQSFESDISNADFFTHILSPYEFRDSIDRYKWRILLESCMLGGISAKRWHSLWKMAKWRFVFKGHHSWKLKIVFLLACINFTATSWLWKALHERNNGKKKEVGIL